jgi:hypothetical protein
VHKLYYTYMQRLSTFWAIFFHKLISPPGLAWYPPHLCKATMSTMYLLNMYTATLVCCTLGQSDEAPSTHPNEFNENLQAVSVSTSWFARFHWLMLTATYSSGFQRRFALLRSTDFHKHTCQSGWQVELMKKITQNIAQYILSKLMH